MSFDLTLANAVTWFAQVTGIVLVAAALPGLLRLRAPRVRLAYFHAILVLCFLLPFVQSPRPASVPAPAPATDASTVVREMAAPTSTSTLPMPAPAPRRRWPVPPAGPTAIVIIAAGIAARLAWLGLGVRAVRKLRQAASPLPDDMPALAAARRIVPVKADVRATPDVAAPVTFGARHPVVLLPCDFETFAAHEQRAVLCHELLHVRRRDWLVTIGEEIVRAVGWFHPAVWWLVDRLQLTREQIVDQEVVRLTGGREEYLDVLLHLAGRMPSIALQPASLFFRRAHLPQRIALLLKEGPMSRRRLVISLAGIAGILFVVAAVLVHVLPLSAQIPSPSATKPFRAAPPAGSLASTNGVEQGVTGAVVGGIAEWPHIVRKPAVQYPAESLVRGSGGRVLVAVRIERDGTISDAQITDDLVLATSDPLLQRAALAAARLLRFAPRPDAVDRFPVLFKFDAAARTVTVSAAPPPPPPPPRPTSGQAMPMARPASTFVPSADPGEEQRLIEARDRNPQDPASHNQLALYYNLRGDFGKMLGAYREWSRMEPGEARVYQNIAAHCWEKSYRDRALGAEARRDLIREGTEAADQALRLQPNYVEALTTKGLLLQLTASMETDRAAYEMYMRQAKELLDRAAAIAAQKRKRMP